MTACRICGKPLYTDESKARGVGPKCSPPPKRSKRLDGQATLFDVPAIEHVACGRRVARRVQQADERQLSFFEDAPKWLACSVGESCVGAVTDGPACVIRGA